MQDALAGLLQARRRARAGGGGGGRSRAAVPRVNRGVSIYSTIKYLVCPAGFIN